MRRVRRLVREMRRKGFHVSGLIIPAVYYAGLKFPLPGTDGAWLTKRTAAIGLGIVTAIYLVLELLRLSDPDMNRRFIRRFGFLLRKSEERGITGSGYYLLGAFLAVLLFNPTIAIAAMLFLIFGDFAAALVGTAIGKIRLLAGKSLEGSLACFAICFVVGMLLFRHVKPDWRVGVRLALSGAAAATVAELLPWRINDNLTIPLISGLAVLGTAYSLGVDVPLP